MILPISLPNLTRYAEIPIRFKVRTQFNVIGDDPASAQLIEKPVPQPWVKDYDAIPNNGPTSWPQRWDLTNWALIIAQTNDHWQAGCVIAHDTPGVNMLAGRKDLAVLWDLRVQPDQRRQGFGAHLFQDAAEWARARGCRNLIIETQNNNVPACRFYQRQGCQLHVIQRAAYDDFPGEVQLLWRLPL